MRPAAYLVECPACGSVDSNTVPALFLDVHRAIDYAARHRGIVIPLRRYYDKPQETTAVSHEANAPA